MKWHSAEDWYDDQNYLEFNRPKKNSKIKKMKNHKEGKREKTRKSTDYNSGSFEE